MTNSRQSASTLRELLGETAGRLQFAESQAARLLWSRVDELQRSIGDDGFVSAQAEQEIMSLYVLARIEESGKTRTHRH